MINVAIKTINNMTYKVTKTWNESNKQWDIVIAFNGKEYKKSFDGLVAASKYIDEFYLTNVAATETDNSADCPKLI